MHNETIYDFTIVSPLRTHLAFRVLFSQNKEAKVFKDKKRQQKRTRRSSFLGGVSPTTKVGEVLVVVVTHWVRLHLAAEMGRGSAMNGRDGHVVEFARTGPGAVVRDALVDRTIAVGDLAGQLSDLHVVAASRGVKAEFALAFSVGVLERDRAFRDATSVGHLRGHCVGNHILRSAEHRDSRGCQVQEFLHGFTPCPPQGTVCLCFTSRNLKT